MKRVTTSLLLIVLVASTAFSQGFYDIFTIETIEITFEESNWDALLDNYYSNDNDEKLMGTVSINGTKFDSIGVKFKGNSTYNANNAKNPLHIYLDYVIDDQNYEGYESIKLSNGKNDPSFVREVLSYEIVRKYMEAPLSNYAKVYINGDYYGMFSNSEAINSDFTENRLYADDDNVRVKCNPESTRNGYGSSLMYLGSDSSNYFDYYEVKSDYGWNDLTDLTYDIKYNQSDIENTLDIDRAIWMMALNNVTVNLDSYIGIFRQNYYLIKDDNNIFLPVIWDLNESLGGFERIDESSGPGSRPGGGSSSTDLSNVDLFLREDDATYPLLQLIYKNERYAKMYIAHCKTILEENFETGWYEAKADSLQDLIADDLSNDANKFYTMTQFYGNIDGSQDNTIGITELMEDRITFLNNQTEFNYIQPTISNITTPENVTAYSTITVTAEVSNATYVQLGYRYSKDERFTKIEMYDDGEHDDGPAGDGVYGISLTVDESNTHFYIYADNDNAGIFSPERAQHEYHKITATANIEISADLTINEIMASNDACQADQDGEYDDWIELYNNTEEEISLLGYYLSDDEDNLTQWAFPDTNIAAGDYLIVWADNNENQTGLHANFKLSSSGESLYLIKSDYTVVNYATFGEQTTDKGYARVPNGTGDFVIQNATFAADNETASEEEEEEEIIYILSDNIAINELMASNNTCQADQNGEYDDWIELYNNTDVDISLSGYYLTDDSTDLNLYAFPDTSIAAGGYLIVWADKDDAQTGLHAGFKLSADGETVYLVNSENIVVNVCVFGEQTDDMGYARVPNGTGNFVIQDATFAANNEASDDGDDNTNSMANNTFDSFNVYPNPVSNMLYVSTGSQNDETNTVTIINLMGQKIYSQTHSDTNEIEININAITTGVYILYIENEEDIYSQKFIKR